MFERLQVKGMTNLLGIRLVFKASFDEANRINASSFRGPGLEEELRCAVLLLTLYRAAGLHPCHITGVQTDHCSRQRFAGCRTQLLRAVTLLLLRQGSEEGEEDDWSFHQHMTFPSLAG